MWIGSSRNNTEAPLGLKLGIVFTYNESEQSPKNVYDKLKDIRLQTRLWRCRGLSLFGKVAVIKSFLLPKMLYLFSVLPASQNVIKRLNNIIYSVLWSGPDKIARSAAIKDIRFRGVNLIDLVTSIELYHAILKQKNLPVQPPIQCEAGRAKTKLFVLLGLKMAAA